jgi:hypothetical protein
MAILSTFDCVNPALFPTFPKETLPTRDSHLQEVPDTQTSLLVHTE